VLPAADLLRFRRPHETAQAFSQRLGSGINTVIRWINDPDALVSLADAERYAQRLEWHPAVIWGDPWIEAVLASDPSDLLADIEGLSDAEAARRCNVSRKTIANWRRTGHGNAATIKHAAKHLATFSRPRRRNHA